MPTKLTQTAANLPTVDKDGNAITNDNPLELEDIEVEVPDRSQIIFGIDTLSQLVDSDASPVGWALLGLYLRDLYLDQKIDNATPPDASETTKGILKLATQALAEAGVDDLTAITPLGAKQYFDTRIKKVTQATYDGLFTFTAAGSYSQILNSGTPTDGQLEINPTTDAIGVNPTSANVSTFTNHWKNSRKWKIGTWEFTLADVELSSGVYTATYTTTAGTELTNATRSNQALQVATPNSNLLTNTLYAITD